MSSQSDGTSSDNDTSNRSTGGRFVSLAAVAPIFEGRFEQIRRKRAILQQRFEAQGGKCFLCLDSGFQYPGKICTADGCESAVRERENLRKAKAQQYIEQAGVGILDAGYTSKTWRGRDSIIKGMWKWCNAYLQASREQLFTDNLQDEKPAILPFLLAFGETGCGKTVLSALLLRYVIEQRVQPGWLCSVPSFLNSQRGLNTDEAAFERAMTVPFLVMDDIGLTKPSEFTDERLYIVINHRYTNRMWTIFTTNLNPYNQEDDLQGQIHTRNLFRIMQYSEKADMTGLPNLRGVE